MNQSVNDIIVVVLGLLVLIVFEQTIGVILIVRIQKRKEKMPQYKRRRYNRGMSVKKRYPGKGKITTRDLARNAYITSRRALIKAQGELKHGTISQPYTTTPNFGNDALYQLDNIATGPGSTQRVGLEIQPWSVTIRYSLLAGTAPRPHGVRVIVFRYKTEAGVPLSITQVLQQGLSANNILGAKEYDARYNSKILYDKTHTMPPIGNDTNSNQLNNIKSQQYYKCVVDLRQMKTVFNAGDSSGVNKESGGTYLYFISDESSGPGPAPSHSFIARYTYRDT